MKKNILAFTLLELLIYITLAIIVSSITLYIYLNTSYGIRDIKQNNMAMTQRFSILVQMEKQLFSLYKEGGAIKLKDGRLSFYTLYPVFYSGIVRAEYFFDRGTKLLYYEEYPYVDGNLGTDGLKKMVLGKFDELDFYFLDNSSWSKDYKDGITLKAIRLDIDNESYYLVLE
jgi:hypothetical protein